MQQELVAIGQHAPTHGTYDEETQQAVYDFQVQAGITPSGTADDHTLAELQRWYEWSAQSHQPAEPAHEPAHDPNQPAPGTLALVDAQGHVVATGTAHPISRSGGLDPAGWTASHLLETAACVASGPAVCAAIQLGNALGWTVAVGYDADLAGVLGITGGMGLYFGSDGNNGLYSTIGADLGAVVGASVAACFTAVDGPPSTLAGDCLAFEAGGGEVLVGGGSLLFSPSGGFIGVAAEIGIGVGLPVAVFASYTNTRLVQF